MLTKLFLIFSSIFLLSTNAYSREYEWSQGVTFLGFLKKHNISQRLYYDMHKEDKELIQEIRAGQSYSINRKKGKITTINIPVSNDLMLQLTNSKKGYSYKYTEIPYKLIEKTISIRIKEGFKKDLYKATKSHYYGKELAEVYSKSVPFHKMRKGDRIIIFYTQRHRNGKPYTSPQIDACLIEIKGKPFYGFLMDNEKYYDSLGKQYKRTYTTRFIRPVPNMKRISSGFTHRRYHPVLKYYRPHLGIDYAARTGSRIVASASGKVIYKGWKGGYGRTIKIKHKGGITTLYAHMKGYGKGINKGSWVKQGRTIGYVGTSGVSTGPHLHFGLYKNNRAVNPARFVKKQTAKVVRIKGKKYHDLRRLVRHYRPQFKETKERIIIKEESSKCLNCYKKLPKRT